MRSPSSQLNFAIIEDYCLPRPVAAAGTTCSHSQPGSLILAPCCCSLIRGADWHDPPPPEHTAPLWPAGLADGGNRGLRRRAVENRRAGPVRSRESASIIAAKQVRLTHFTLQRLVHLGIRARICLTAKRWLTPTLFANRHSQHSPPLPRAGDGSRRGRAPRTERGRRAPLAPGCPAGGKSEGGSSRPGCRLRRSPGLTEPGALV